MISNHSLLKANVDFNQINYKEAEMVTRKDNYGSDLRGALARGYCHKENENKILDPDLIESMAQEVEKMNDNPIK